MDSPSKNDTIRLRVLLAPGADVDAVEATITDLGGSVEEKLQYSTYVVELPETKVGKLQNTSGIRSIETASVLSQRGDAGEDVSLDPE